MHSVAKRPGDGESFSPFLPSTSLAIFVRGTYTQKIKLIL